MSLFDPVRQKSVQAAPEEKVRQALIGLLVDLGYPKSLMAVEFPIKSLEYVLEDTGRRADLICFAKDLHPQHSLYPLLLVECKACPITEAVFRQVEGYNQLCKAPYLLVANQEEIFLSDGLNWSEGLATYEDLFRLAKISLASGERSKI